MQKIKIGMDVSQCTSKWSANFQIKVKGQGHRTSKTSKAIWRHIYLWLADQVPADTVPTADWAWPKISTCHAARSNWKDGHIPHQRRHLCLL